MTPARRAQVYASQTGGLMTARQMQRYRHKALRGLKLTDRLPAPPYAPADGASLFRPSSSAAPAPAPTDFHAAGVGVTPDSVAVRPASSATEGAPRQTPAVHAPTVAVIRTCIPAAVGASLDEVTP